MCVCVSTHIYHQTICCLLVVFQFVCQAVAHFMFCGNPLLARDQVLARPWADRVQSISIWARGPDKVALSWAPYNRSQTFLRSASQSPMLELDSWLTFRMFVVCCLLCFYSKIAQRLQQCWKIFLPFVCWSLRTVFIVWVGWNRWTLLRPRLRSRLARLPPAASPRPVALGSSASASTPPGKGPGDKSVGNADTTFPSHSLKWTIKARNRNTRNN